MPPLQGSRRRLSEREQRESLRTFRRCRSLVEQAKKVLVEVERDLGRPQQKYDEGTQDQLFSVKEVARRLSIQPIRLREAWAYVHLVQQYPALAPPACGMHRVLWIGGILATVPEGEREDALTGLLQLSQRALKLRYQKSLSRRAAKPKAPPKAPGRKLQRINGAIWHERLAEIRQHMQQLGTCGLVELLAKTWKPEVQEGYLRELQWLIDELTMLHHRISSVSQPPQGEDR